MVTNRLVVAVPGVGLLLQLMIGLILVSVQIVRLSRSHQIAAVRGYFTNSAVPSWWQYLSAWSVEWLFCCAPDFRRCIRGWIRDLYQVDFSFS